VSTFRRLSQVSSSSRSSTTSTRGLSVTFCRLARAFLVDGVSPGTNDATTWTRPDRARSDKAPRKAAAFIFLGVRWS
jgi:hypothetical protein